MDLMLECRSLGFTYMDTPVLKDISFQVDRGTFCAILGRNGSGKTTLLHCLNRILTPASGQILIHGKNMNHFSRNNLARAISLVPQEHIDIFPYRVIDVVVMGRAPFLKLSATPDETDYAIATQALTELNAQGLALKNFNRISGGERQIALLARALTQASPIMLLDEPTNHLDFNNQYQLLSTIKDLCQTKGISIIATLHDPNLAAIFADEVIMIKNGKILVQGKKAGIMTRETISTLYDTDTGVIMINGQKKIFLPNHILEES